MARLQAGALFVSALFLACSAGGAGGGGGGDPGPDASNPPDSTVSGDVTRADGPSCSAGSANCGACTPLDGCGWCRRTNSCVPGTSTGSTTGGCTGADWAFVSSQCGGDGGAPPPPNCTTGSANCGACTPLPGCGWCRRTNSCVPGTSSGSTTGGCTGADWAYVSSQCAGGDGGSVRDGGPTCPAGVPRSCNLTLSGAARTCTAGQMVVIGCSASCGLGTCTGDAVMQICPGSATTPCATAIASNDDAAPSPMCNRDAAGPGDPSLCPLVTFTCPADGRYTVWVGAYGSGMATCTPAVR